jgi:diketogulonate reductase-like aldo/keto reductase
MYADGESERLVGEALRGLREQVFLVSKAYPHNASRQRLRQACEASLKRLGTDRLDLYLLHWRGRVPLAETVEAMEDLVAAGKIRRWGVSNLDTPDLEELLTVGGAACATDQVLYNLTRRGPEYDLLPWLADRDLPVMAYSPIEQGRLLENVTLRALAAGLSATPAQVALAWVLRQDQVLAIPKAGSVAHVQENRVAAELHLSVSDLAALDAAFPRPTKRRPLEML